MTEHKISPLQWLSTKFASLNHSHNEYLTEHQDITGKEDTSNKVTSLSENSTNTQYPSAKTVYDELMTVRTVTPTIDNDGSETLNNVTKNVYYSYIDSSDLEYFEKIVYNITFEDNDFQMFSQPSPNGSNIQIIYFDGTDCYWGEIDNNHDLTKGSLICEGNTIQATLNKDKTVTIGDTITDWDIRDKIRMFGNIDFTYTIYSHKYLDTDYPYTFEYHNFEKAPMGDATINSVTKEYGDIFLSKWDNPIEAIYTITFNDDDSSYLDFGYEATIYFDGTDCYWGEWDKKDYSVLNKGTLICEGNVVQATYLCNDDKIYFPDGNSISTMYNWNYFGDVKIKVRNKILVLEYASNKTYNIENSFNDAICYPSIATLKNYAETKINKVTSISSSSTHTKYPSAKAVYDNTVNELKTITPPISSFIDIYDLSNWNGASRMTSSNEVLTLNAVGGSWLNQEFTTSNYYTLTFDIICAFNNREGIFLFSEPSATNSTETGYQITQDVSTTYLVIKDANGTITYDDYLPQNKNYYTIGTHHCKLVRNGNVATFSFDGEVLLDNIDVTGLKNTIGINKWQNGSIQIGNIAINTEYPTPVYIENGTDLNTIVDRGFYYQGATANTTEMSNLPNDDHSAFCLMVEDMGGNARKQTWTKQSDINSMFVRIRKWDNTWTSWKPVWEDTAWKDVSFPSGFTHHSEGDRVRYRRVGKVVELRGAVKNTNQLTLSNMDTTVTLATISDTSCRPSKKIVCRQQGSQMNTFLLTINTNGAITLSRYGLTSVTNVPASSWLNVHTTFLVD